MTIESEPPDYDRYVADPKGRLSQAAAALSLKTLDLIHRAKDARKLSSKVLAHEMGVTKGRISQILNGDGNLHIASVGRVFAACGYELTLVAKPTDGVDLPTLSSDAPRQRHRKISPPITVTAEFGPEHGVTVHLPRARTALENAATPASRWGAPKVVHVQPGMAFQLVNIERPKQSMSFEKSTLVVRTGMIAVDAWVQQTKAAVVSEDPAATKL